MNFLKKAADAVVNLAVIVVSSAVLVGVVIYASRHVTCLNLFDKVCFVY